MLTPPSVRNQSEPLPIGAVPHVDVGAPAPVEIFVGPNCIEGVPVPATEICGFELFDAGGVPPDDDPPKSLKVKPGPVPLPIKPWFGPPAVR